MNILQNIPVDPQIRQALENQVAQNQNAQQANQPPPIFVGLFGFLLALCELVVCFVLSISPSWNIDSYIRLVYHWLFKARILHQIQVRDTELAMKAPLAPPEIVEQLAAQEVKQGGALTDNNTVLKEEPLQEEQEPLKKQENDHAAEEPENSDIQQDPKPQESEEFPNPEHPERVQDEGPVIAPAPARFDWT